MSWSDWLVIGSLACFCACAVGPPLMGSSCPVSFFSASVILLRLSDVRFAAMVAGRVENRLRVDDARLKRETATLLTDGMREVRKDMMEN